MVRKKTLLLSMLISALLVSIMNTGMGHSPYTEGAVAGQGFTGATAGMGTFSTFITGLLVQYVILVVAVYLFFRGIAKRFED